MEYKTQCGCIVVESPPNFKIKYCPKHEAASLMYEALIAWDKLRAMRPLDSGADIEEILEECSRITDKALAKAEGK